ncbi:hypothetical protein POSPLADRAFT_1031142 [Postia placenta MAD-698-R-SB12]|uniref:Uncharacterized protein n=1 Tax=Postia placenta MAD-698-R-SB12 TaxID=670580 RepID=A0A1X6NBE3_9APHY|nr:hypothetical protein POSPLADRAFT_1031142 [Postia placenta MAD-698-R-SB12]OSX65921.1 hypothetical protein POSPLADRAFT_1031142 [Postia placenta MAD-698-R-SB12]
MQVETYLQQSLGVCTLTARFSIRHAAGPGPGEIDRSEQHVRRSHLRASQEGESRLCRIGGTRAIAGTVTSAAAVGRMVSSIRICQVVLDTLWISKAAFPPESAWGSAHQESRACSSGLPTSATAGHYAALRYDHEQHIGEDVEAEQIDLVDVGAAVRVDSKLVGGVQ